MNLSGFSLGGKLIVSLVVLILFPLVLAAVFINYFASGLIGEKSRETQLEVLKQTHMSIANVIKETEYVSITLLSDGNLQNIAKYNLSSSFLDVERNKKDLFVSTQSLTDLKPYIDSICFNDQGNILFQYGDIVSKEDTRFNDEASRLSGRAFWTSLYSLKDRVVDSNEKKIISLIRVVNDLDSSSQFGVLRISISEAQMSDLYAGINTWKNGKVFILNGSGDVISSTDKTMIGRNLELYAKKILIEDEGFFDDTFGTQQSSVFHYTLADTGWHVVQIVPTKELEKQTTLINVFIFATISFCVLFGILFYVIQNRSIVIPLKKMSREMHKIKNGNFEVKLDIKSSDEIGRLGNIFVEMVSRIKNLIDNEYKIKLREKEARLQVLETQINPHFLYNTLDSIRWLAIKNKDYAVSNQIEALADIFRHVLNKGMSVTTIREEVEYLKSYLFIQKNRFGEKIKMTIQVEDDLLSCQTLKLLLQPLVENAFKHGLENKTEDGKVDVTIEKSGEANIRFTVVDDGLGTNEKWIEEMLLSNEESEKVFALKNIRDRIQFYYGKEYGLKLYSQVGQGTKVEIIIPRISFEKVGNVHETSDCR